MTDIALRQLDSGIVQFEPVTGARRELLKRTICRDLTDDEMDLFAAVCNRRRLDPFVRQIHAVKRRQWNAKLNAYEEVMVIQTGIDGYRLVADRTQQRDGIDGPFWCDDDGQWNDVWLQTTPPAAAKVIVYRKGHTRGYVGIAHWSEYVETYKDKQGNVRATRMWEQMPAGQLAKCAEALASRKAFPEELSGIYTDEEMGQAEVETVSPGPKQVTGPPAGPGAAISIPTHDQVEALRDVDDARQLLIHAPGPFRTRVKLNVSDGDDELWRQFWKQESLPVWKDYLHDAITDAITEMSGADSRTPPAVDAAPDSQSPPAQVSKGKAHQAGGDTTLQGGEGA